MSEKLDVLETELTTTLSEIRKDSGYHSFTESDLKRSGQTASYSHGTSTGQGAKRKLNMDQLTRSPLKVPQPQKACTSGAFHTATKSAVTRPQSSRWIVPDRILKRNSAKRMTQSSWDKVEWSPLKADAGIPHPEVAIRKRPKTSNTCHDCDQWYESHHAIYRDRTTHEKKTLRHSEKHSYLTPPGSKMWDISWPSSDED